MNLSEILNLIAIIFIPITAVIVGQFLQNRSQKRKDKMDIFKTLMVSRNGWTPERVSALNIIDIVFADDKNVRRDWKEYFEKLCIENPTGNDLVMIQKSHYKLLETMANSLGYKDKITWETIQNPYIPKGMIEMEQMHRTYQEGQVAFANLVKNINPQLVRNVPMLKNSMQQEKTDGAEQ